MTNALHFVVILLFFWFNVYTHEYEKTACYDSVSIALTTLLLLLACVIDIPLFLTLLTSSITSNIVVATAAAREQYMAHHYH